MSFKDTLKKNLGDKKNMSQYRYEASKLMFVLVTYFFFVFFFLTAAGYYPDIFGQLVTPSYLLSLISIALFSYFYAEHKFSNKKIIYGIAGLGGIIAFASALIVFI